MRLRIASLLVGCSLVIAGCSPDPAKPAPSTGASAGATATAAITAKAAAPAAVPSSAPLPAPAAAVWAKTIHIKRTQDECTFDLDVPEVLNESAKDGASFTLTSASFQFVGFAGQDLHSTPTNALDMFHGEYRDVYRGTENGVQLAIVTKIDVAKNTSGNHSISGMGGEPYSSERRSGCTFICDGGREHEADVVKICKSVRISVKAAKK